MVHSSRRIRSDQILNGATAYDILGVRQGASPEAIMQAYRDVLHTSHPDGRMASQPRFSLDVVRAAFEVLRDPVQRAQYDQGLARARKLAMRAQTLKAINDNATKVEGRAGYFVSRLGAIFWPFQKD